MSAEDVRKLHSKFGIYGECDCDLEHRKKPKSEQPEEDSPEYHGGKEPVYCEEIGYTCSEPQWVCRECNTDDGEIHEYSDSGEYPCATLKALEKP